VRLLTLAVGFVLDPLAAILLLAPVATGCRPSDRSRRLSVQKRSDAEAQRQPQWTRAFAEVIPRTSLLAFRSCTVAFQSRDFLPCGFEFLVKLIDAIRKQLNGSAMSLPIKPHVRFGCCRGGLGFLTSC
jgi:hypothetical protein